MVTREGNSSNTDGHIALWWTGGRATNTARLNLSLCSRVAPNAALDHLRFGCSLFSIDDGQSKATDSSIVLQDQSRLGRRLELPAQQAEGQPERAKPETSFSLRATHAAASLPLTEERRRRRLQRGGSLPPGQVFQLFLRSNKVRSQPGRADAGRRDADLVLGAVGPDAVQLGPGGLPGRVSVSVSRQHSLRTHTHTRSPAGDNGGDFNNGVHLSH